MNKAAPLGGIRHICFDKDGTLTDVHCYWAHICGLRADLLAAKHGLGASKRNLLLDAMGIDLSSGRIKPGGPVGYKPRKTIVEGLSRLMDGMGIPVPAEGIDEAFREIDKRQQETGDYRIELLPSVREVLARLKASGAVLSIYTSDRKENGERILQSLGLRELFAAVVGGGCVKKAKPDPEGFLTACERVGVEPSSSAYVGDTVEDMQMAVAGSAGARIGVLTGLGTKDELGRLTPHVHDSLEGMCP